MSDDVRTIHSGHGVVQVHRSGEHVLLRSTGPAVSLTAEKAREVIAAIAELLPPAFPEPYVVKPSVAQLVLGARVEYEGKPGEVLTGWVGRVTMYLGSDPGVEVGFGQPGALGALFLAPHIVPLEKILRATCGPDPAPGECWKCHQSGAPKGGEYPCEGCFRPTTHDPEEPRAAADLGNGTERP